MMHYVMLCSIHNGSKDVTVVKSTQHFQVSRSLDSKYSKLIQIIGRKIFTRLNKCSLKQGLNMTKIQVDLIHHRHLIKKF